MIDYNDPKVIARQNIAPNASCDIDGVFYDIRNCVHELATLRAEVERLREALWDISSIKDQNCYAVAVAKEALK